MAIFGLVCEGVTDQIVIENILCGFYDNEDLEADIEPLQPAYDVTTQQQQKGAFGGWKGLLQYLKSKRFRQAIPWHEAIIIQIDSDICEAFKIPLNQPIEQLIKAMRNNLIKQIEFNFYQKNQSKIIFAISVHSLECWILPLHQSNEDEITHDCFKQLKTTKATTAKKRPIYNKLTQDFLDNKKLLQISNKNSSLKIFISTLPTSYDE